MGNGYDEDLGVNATWDSQAAHWWSGGQFHIAFLTIDSTQPSGNLVGDEQGFSNIAFPSRTRLYSLWYSQHWDCGRWSALAGLRALNGSFATGSVESQYATRLANSSFGTIPTIALNGPSSITPLPGWGAQMAYHINHHWRIRGGVFAGNAAVRSRPFVTGAMAIEELDYTSARMGHFALGGWYDTATRTPLLPSILSHHDSGVYVYAQQPMIQAASIHFGSFEQGSQVIGTDILVRRYVGAGFLASGWSTLFPGSFVSLGVAAARNSREAQHLLGLPSQEIAYETMTSIQLRPWLTLQPDIQYIMHPSGTGGIPNAVVALLRVTVAFSSE